MEELLEDQMNRKMKQAAAQAKGRSGNDSDSSGATNERKKSKLFSFLKLGQTWPEIIEGRVSPVTGAVTRELVIIQRYNEYKPKIGRHCEQAAAVN